MSTKGWTSLSHIVPKLFHRGVKRLILFTLSVDEFFPRRM